MHEAKNIIKPKALKQGDLIGIFTPSWPANTLLKEKYLHSLNQLKILGFEYKEGCLTAKQIDQGYRSASPKERAQEFMDLILDPDVKCLMSTIGGSNSASMIPYLDFKKIAESRKLICGYSDVTSLHLSILKFSNLSTMYSLALVPSFGEYPCIVKESLDHFLLLACHPDLKKRQIYPPLEWSKQFIDARNPNWKDIKRGYLPNKGWKNISKETKARAPVVVANLETLISAAGTPYFPDLEGKILILEETAAIFSKTERNFRQLERMSVFDKIAGLIVSKPGEIESEGAPFSHEELIMEIVQERSYPIVYNFDCGHTFPMISLAQNMIISIDCSNKEKHANIYLEEAAVS